MRLILLTILLFVSLSTMIFAQKKKVSPATPDISGTWVLDKEKSHFTDIMERDGYKDYTLTISQKETEIKIIQNFSFQETDSEYTTTLFTDKRGEENKDLFKKYHYIDVDQEIIRTDETTIKSKTFWKQEKLIRDGTYRAAEFFGAEKNHIIKQIYELSADGKTLKMTTNLQIIFNPQQIEERVSKLLFQKND